jgi:hypothetical protein
MVVRLILIFYSMVSLFVEKGFIRSSAIVDDYPRYQITQQLADYTFKGPAAVCIQFDKDPTLLGKITARGKSHA